MPTQADSINHDHEVASCDEALCRHCRQQLTSKAEKESGFCCVGCRAASEFILSLGLDYFYRLRESEADWTARPVKLETSKFAHFNDENFKKAFVVSETSACHRMTFQLPGIHCAACVWLLEKLPQVITGITQLRVDLLRGTAVVRFNPTQIKPSAIGQSFAMLGYHPHPLAAGEIQSKYSPADRIFAIQLGVAAFGAMNVMLLFFARHQGYLTSIEASYADLLAWVSFLLALPVATFSAWPFYRTSLGSLRSRRLHIDLPIAIAIVGGFTASAVNTILGRPEIYFDTVTALVFLLLLGRWTQRFMMRRIGNATDLLHSLTPLSAKKIVGNGEIHEVFIGSLAPGDVVEVQDGEAFPCDGEIVFGKSHVNNAILTGESRLLPLDFGTEIFAGARNVGGVVQVKATQVGTATRLGKLIEQIQLAPVRESKIARFVDRISVYFIVGVLALALLTIFIWSDTGFWHTWDHVIALLVVSCPCALGIATPITLSLASMRAAKRGILLKNGEALERLSEVREVLFDKTGTLTQANVGIAVSELVSPKYNWEMIWGIVSVLESQIEHPIAEVLTAAASSKIKVSYILEERRVVFGEGIYGKSTTGQRFLLGSLRWLQKGKTIISPRASELIRRYDAHTLVGLSVDGELAALFVVSDIVRPEAAKVVARLRNWGIQSSIVSGDSVGVVSKIARQVGIAPHACFGEQTPEKKAELVDAKGRRAAFVGDGANDGLALSRAGVGIGIKGGAEICMSVSDIFLMRPDLQLVSEAIVGAKCTVRQIHRHLAISAIYNICAATLAVSGYIGPLAAALVMPLSSFSVLLSSLWRPPFRKENQ